MNCFIITGTSSGIGEDLAKALLEDGSIVFGISRRDAVNLSAKKYYTHLNFDLSDVQGIENVLEKIFDQIEIDKTEMICLINNAALLEPLRTIENCNAEEILKNLQVSLVAPMILASCFIKQSDSFTIRRKIINVTSGSASYPAAGMSVYCTAKAGINMFTRCVGEEQMSRNNPIEIIAVDPGMVETEMQLTAREKNVEEFEMANFFKEAHQTGQLKSTGDLVKHFRRIIYKDNKPGKLMKYSEG